MIAPANGFDGKTVELMEELFGDKKCCECGKDAKRISGNMNFLCHDCFQAPAEKRRSPPYSPRIYDTPLGLIEPDEYPDFPQATGSEWERLKKFEYLPATRNSAPRKIKRTKAGVPLVFRSKGRAVRRTLHRRTDVKN